MKSMLSVFIWKPKPNRIKKKPTQKQNKNQNKPTHQKNPNQNNIRVCHRSLLCSRIFFQLPTTVISWSQGEGGFSTLTVGAPALLGPSLFCSSLSYCFAVYCPSCTPVVQGSALHNGVKWSNYFLLAENLGAGRRKNLYSQAVKIFWSTDMKGKHQPCAPCRAGLGECWGLRKQQLEQEAPGDNTISWRMLKASREKTLTTKLSPKTRISLASASIHRSVLCSARMLYWHLSTGWSTDTPLLPRVWHNHQGNGRFRSKLIPAFTYINHFIQ